MPQQSRVFIESRDLICRKRRQTMWSVKSRERTRQSVVRAVEIGIARADECRFGCRVNRFTEGVSEAVGQAVAQSFDPIHLQSMVITPRPITDTKVRVVTQMGSALVVT